MDKTSPHDPFLKDGAKRKMRSFCSRPPMALFRKRDQGPFQDIFFKPSTIRQQSPPEFAYANSLKGMRIHRDGSLAHAEGWEQETPCQESAISLEYLKIL